METFEQALQRKYAVLYEAIEQIAFYGLSRPPCMQEDDGDGHFKKAAHAMVCIAALARRDVRA